MNVKRSGVLATGLCALVLLGGAGLAHAARAATDGYTVAFAPTGHTQTWTVPNGVTSVTFEAAGGGGRSPGADPNVAFGSGADVHGTIAVAAGQVLTIAVGENGGTAAGGWGDIGMSGGRRTPPRTRTVTAAPAAVPR